MIRRALDRIRAEWQQLTPKERGYIRTGAKVIGAGLTSYALRRWAATAVTAVTASAITVAAVGPSAAPGPGPLPPLSHQGLANETPPGSPLAKDPLLRAAAIATSQTAAKKTTSGPDTPSEGRPLATPSQRGCASREVRNFSSRMGARPALLVLHYTVSRNRPGTGDVDAIVNYFNDPRAQASSQYVIDFEGNCAYIVQEQDKAWTQGFFNPWSISIEFIAVGDEPVWPEAGLRKGALVFADSAKRWGIPIRWASVDGCKIVRSGIIDHDALDCGNVHTDVTPYFPKGRFLQLVREAYGGGADPARRYQVCSWRKPMPKPACARAIRAGDAVELRLRRGHTRVSVVRR